MEAKLEYIVPINVSKWAGVLNATKRQRRRFWKHVTAEDGCWLFNVGNGNKYNIWYLNRTELAAHRVAKTWATRQVMENFICCHKCRNKNCVRPSHIVWGTQHTNCEDKIRDGTHFAKWRGEQHAQAKLKTEEVLNICKDFVFKADTVRELARKYELPFSTVASIVSGQNWRSVTADILAQKATRHMEWGRKQNSHRKTKIDVDTVRLIKRLLAAKAMTHEKIAAQTGVKKASVTQINRGRSWSWVLP